jgi:hypothetical protein
MAHEKVVRSREELLGFAKERIADMVDFDPACGEVAPLAMRLLGQIVLDGQPLPQPTYNDGGIDVTWLVNDWAVILIVIGEEPDEDGDNGWILWAEGPDRKELFDAAGGPEELIGREELRWTHNLLASMGDKVRGYEMWDIWKT